MQKKILLLLSIFLMMIVLFFTWNHLIKRPEVQEDTNWVDTSGLDYPWVAPQTNKYFSDYPKCTDSMQIEVVREIERSMVFIQGGSFILGNNLCKTVQKDSVPYFTREFPPHRVKVPSFYLCKFEVTQLQYKALTGMEPSSTLKSDFPVDQLGWHDAVKFIERLNALSGKKYRLPSEAEWEYANRAGNSDPLFPNKEYLDSHEWYRDNSGMEMHPVGTKKPNRWGLYDMNGNVAEWCADDYAEDYSDAYATADPYVSKDRGLDLFKKEGILGGI